MHEGWEIARPVARGAKKRRPLYVSLNKRGEIVMSERAFAAIGPTAMVTLLYDPERRTIGVKFPVPKDKHFFYVRKYGRGRRNRIVRAGSMLKQFGITVEKTMKFENVRVEKIGQEPMLVLELGTQGNEMATSI